MKLKNISNFVTSRIGRQVLIAQKHSPVILFSVGVAGVVGTVVLASRATLRLDEVLNDGQVAIEKAQALEHPNYSIHDRDRDVLVIKFRTAGEVVRLYAPAFVVGAVAVAALTGAHVVLNRRYLGATAAYAVLDEGFRKYRQRVVAELGVDKDREFRYDMRTREIVEETSEGPVTKQVRDIRAAGKSVYSVCFDEKSANWSREHMYNQMFLASNQNYANDLLKSRGHVFLNDVHDMLGLPRTREGAVVGWVLGNGDNHVDFGVFEGDRMSGMRFVLGQEHSIWLDFNVDGIIYDKI